MSGGGKITHGTWPIALGGGPRDYIECDYCHRTQTIKPQLSVENLQQLRQFLDGEPAGITSEEAKLFGWAPTKTGWICPMGCGRN